MRKRSSSFRLLLIVLAVMLAIPGGTFAAVTLSAGDFYKAGDTVTIEGTITPGRDLYIAIAEQKMFAPRDTHGLHEAKRLKTDGKKRGFNSDTAIPPLYYLLTTTPGKFGKVVEKKFGGPSFFTQGGKRGLYKTTIFKLATYDRLAPEARSVLGPIKTVDQWNLFIYAHESSYGINTIVKEGTNFSS